MFAAEVKPFKERNLVQSLILKLLHHVLLGQALPRCRFHLAPMGHPAGASSCGVHKEARCFCCCPSVHLHAAPVALPRPPASTVTASEEPWQGELLATLILLVPWFWGSTSCPCPPSPCFCCCLLTNPLCWVSHRSLPKHQRSANNTAEHEQSSGFSFYFQAMG